MSNLKEEDLELPFWQQDFEWSYQSWMPVRHLDYFVADEEVEASASHVGQVHQGKDKQLPQYLTFFLQESICF